MSSDLRCLVWNVGIVRVPDSRLDVLAKLGTSNKISDLELGRKEDFC